MFAQDGLGKFDGPLATLEVLLEGGDGIHLFIAPPGHRRVHPDRAGCVDSLDGSVEARGAGFGFRQRLINQSRISRI